MAAAVGRGRAKHCSVQRLKGEKACDDGSCSISSSQHLIMDEVQRSHREYMSLFIILWFSSNVVKGFYEQLVNVPL